MRPATWLLPLAACAVAAPAGATVLADWDLDEVTRRADLIVVGVVESQRFVHADELMTESVIRVETTLYGEPTERLVLSQLGGRSGRIVTEIDGDARLRPQERVLLYTYRHTDGRRYLVGMSLGAYHLDAKEDGTVAHQTIDVQVFDPSGRLHAPLGERSVDLDRVRQTIRRVHP